MGVGSTLRQVLGRPGVHVVAGWLFAVSFVWPFLAIDSPLHTWIFLTVAWAASLVALVAISRGVESPDDEEEPDDDQDSEPASRV